MARSAETARWEGWNLLIYEKFSGNTVTVIARNTAMNEEIGVIHGWGVELDMAQHKSDGVTWQQLALLLTILFVFGSGLMYWYNQTIQTSISSLEKTINLKLDPVWNDFVTKRAAAAGIPNALIKNIEKKSGERVTVSYNAARTAPGVRIEMVYSVKEIVGDEVTFVVYPKIYRNERLLPPFRPQEIKVQIGSSAVNLHEIELNDGLVTLPLIRIAVIGQSATQLVVATDRLDSPSA